MAATCPSVVMPGHEWVRSFLRFRIPTVALARWLILNWSRTQPKRCGLVLAWRVSHWLGGAYNEIKHFDETWVENEYTLSRFGRQDRSVYHPEYTSRYGVALDVVAQLEAQHDDLLRRDSGLAERCVRRRIAAGVAAVGADQ